MEDFSIIKCSICGETKKRISAGKYPNGKDRRWVDESGRQFCGSKCPTCWSKSVADKKRYKAEEAKRVKKALEELE